MKNFIRRFVLVFAIVLLILSINNNSAISRASGGEIVSAYYMEDQLYSLIQLPTGRKADNLSVQVENTGKINYQYAINNIKLESLKESKTPVSYLFMIDASTSMPKYKDSIYLFATTLMNALSEESRFMVATFGEEFRPISEFSTDKQAVGDVIKNVSYTDQKTALYTGLIDAVDYFNTKVREAGEIYNIIIISDGVEYDKTGPTLDEVKKKIEEATPLFIHGCAFPNSKADEESPKILGSFSRMTGGIDTMYEKTVKKDITIANADKISSYINQLYAVKFKLLTPAIVGETADIRIVFSNTEVNKLAFKLEKTGIPCLKVNEELIPDEEVTDTEKPEVKVPEDTSKENEEKQMQPVVEGEEAELSEGENSEVLPASSDESTKCKILGIPVMIFVVVLVVLLLVLASLFILIFKRRKKSSRVSAANSSSGIFMSLEVISGNCGNKKKELFLVDEIVIGRSKGCDLIFRDKCVSERNSRVFLQGNMIYIEDLDSAEGTTLYGMRLQAPNRLRSGDEITIGTVKFKLKF